MLVENWTICEGPLSPLPRNTTPLHAHNINSHLPGETLRQLEHSNFQTLALSVM